MPKYNLENEKAKRAYLSWLRNARGRDEATLDEVAAAIDAFQDHIGRRPFARFRREQAINFKTALTTELNPRTGKPPAKATVYSRLRTLKAFFEWLSREPGYRRGPMFSDAAYFSPTEKDARIATAARERPAPSLEQVLSVLANMPDGTVLQRRDRAVMALILLTGARDAAVASLRLKHLDLARSRLIQDAREMRTKAGKTITTVFFPVGAEPLAHVTSWVEELRGLGFGPSDPLFPATSTEVDQDGRFSPAGLKREPWSSAEPIRRIFRTAFTQAGLPYHHPHSLRRTLMKLAYDLELTPRELKAWSQNLGHEGVLTSLTSYGSLTLEEQSAAVTNAGERRSRAFNQAEVARALQVLSMAAGVQQRA